MKRIVIAPYLVSRELFKKYRKEDPFNEVKFFTKESFLSNYYYQYGEDAFLFVTNKYGKDYDLSKQILEAVSRMNIDSSDSDKLKELSEIKHELIKNNLLTKNEYFDEELKNSEIDVYFYSEDDSELNKYLSHQNVKYFEPERIIPSCVESFYSNNEELSYVFNKIAKLLSDGVKGSKIAIYGLSDADELIYSRLLKNYKFHINNAYPKTLLSKVYPNRFIANILEVGVDEAFNYELENSKDDPNFDEFTSLVNKYRNDSLKDVYQAEIYQSVFNKVKLQSKKYKDGIEVVKEPICPKGGYLFIVNMVQGKYPILIKDNGYLSDNEKVKLGVITSEEENANNYNLFINYLKQEGTIFLSYSRCSFSAKYYPSPLINSLGILENYNHNISTYYSFDEAQLSYAGELDKERNYLKSSELLKKFRNNKDIKIPYRVYDYRLKDINHFTFDKVIKLSYTSATAYYQCAFKFYLNNVLRIDELEDSFSLSLGNLAHKILENIPSGKSFDELYDEAYENLKDKFEKNDWVFLRRIKEDLRRIFDYINEFEMQVKDASYKREYELNAYLDSQVLLTGKLDKVIVSNKYNNIAVVDYKTGHAKFEEPLTEYGLSLQLPTYSLLLKENEKFNTMDISGLFLQPLLLSTSDSLYSRVSGNDLNSYSKLVGLLSNKENTIEYFDSSDKSQGLKYLAGIKYNKDGSLSATSLSKLRDQSYFDGLSALAKDLYLEAGHNILNNKFDINPKNVNGEDVSCKYCPFRDICYRDESAFIKINTKKESEEDNSNGLN